MTRACNLVQQSAIRAGVSIRSELVHVALNGLQLHCLVALRAARRVVSADGKPGNVPGAHSMTSRGVCISLAATRAQVFWFRSGRGSGRPESIR